MVSVDRTVFYIAYVSLDKLLIRRKLVDLYHRLTDVLAYTTTELNKNAKFVITLKCIKMFQAVEENVRQIVLHSNVDSINTITLSNSDSGAPFALNPLDPFSLEPEYHFLKINLVSSMVVGQNYTLSISYSSTMNEGPMKRGIWRGWYRDANNTER